MKKTAIFFLALTLTLTFGLLACSAPDPIAKEGAQKEFTLDTSGEKSKTLSVSDYIDTNGADEESIMYTTSRIGTAINVTSVKDNSFTVTAVSAGTAAVTLKAFVGEEEKVSIEITFTVINSSVSVVGFTETKGFKLEGAPAATKNAPYSFTVTLKEYYIGTPSVAYTIGGEAGSALTPTEAPVGTFTFTIPADKVTANIVLGEVTGVSRDPLAPYDTGLPEDFFTVDVWQNVSGDSSEAKPTLSGSTLTFTEITKRYINLFDSSLVLGNADNQPHNYAFSMRAAGDFTMRLLASEEVTTSDSAANKINFTYSGGKFSLWTSVGGNQANKAEAADADTLYSKGSWNQIEFIITAVRRTDIPHTSGASEQTEDRGCIKVEVYINKQLVEFAINGQKTTSVQHNNTNRATKLDDGILYVNRLPNTTGGTRYGRCFLIQAIDNKEISLRPYEST